MQGCLHPINTTGLCSCAATTDTVHSGGEDMDRAGAAGVYGTPLLPHDLALVQLRPLRPFSLGELCAFPSDRAAAGQEHGAGNAPCDWGRH